MIDELYQLVMSIFGVFVKYGILLEVQWILRNYNDCVDSCSRIFDKDDWSVLDYIFRYFEKIWGLYIIDVFVNCKNNKVNRFYLKYWYLGLIGVDVFVYDWFGENCWIVLFFVIVCKVLKYM